MRRATRPSAAIRAETISLYARDKAFVDIVGHQGNDFQITDAFWEELNELTAAFDVPGRFVCAARLRMVGQHRHGRRPQRLLPPRGPADPPLVAHSGRGREPSERRIATPRNELFEAMRSDEDAVVIAHVGGRYADIKYRP